MEQETRYNEGSRPAWQPSETGDAPVPLQPLTDYHCHLLPGVDDGPGNIGESIEMARLLARAGYRFAHCTPHMIRYRYDADNATVLDVLRDVQREIDSEGIPLRLLSGREYFLDEFLLEYLTDPMPLEGTGRLLVEIPPGSLPGFARDMIAEILNRGFSIMIAHPERCPLLGQHAGSPKPAGLFKRWKPADGSIPESSQASSGLLEWLIDSGCSFQANLGSFRGSYGRTPRFNAESFSAAGIYTHYGTDAHCAADLDQLADMVHRFYRG